MNKLFKIFTAIFTVSLLAACGNQSTGNQVENNQLKIVTTFYPLYDFTKAVVGEDANVTMLVEGNVEVHSFEPTPSQIQTMQEADVIVYHDFEMEAWVESALESIDTSNITVIDAGSAVGYVNPESQTIGSDEYVDDHEDDHADDHAHEYDPHSWLDPKRAIVEVETIKDKLVAAYPDKTELYEANTKNYVNEIEQLDADLTDALVGKKQDTFVVQHAAFGYLADAYGLTQVAMSGITENVDPDPKTLGQIVDFIKANNIEYVYFQDNSSDKVAQTVANEAGIKTAKLHSLETIPAEDFKAGKNYIDLMRENLEALSLSIN